MSPLLCAMLTALLWPRAAFPALPPATTGASVQPGGTASSREAVRDPNTKASANDGMIWAIPARFRIGGSISYDMRRSMAEDGSSSAQNVLSTLRGTVNTFIWEPWFAQVNGSLGATAIRSSTDGDSGFQGATTNSLALTGGGQLSLLPISPFPFEAHFERNDSRTSGELVSVEAHSGQRFGFTQQFLRSGGSVMLGWDRATQDAVSSGRDQQDSWRLNASHAKGKHRFSLNGDRSENMRARTGESVTQNNLTIQHSYTPAAMFSIENMANMSRSGFKLLGAESHTDLAQLSTLAFWRSSSQPLTISSGARLLTMEGESGSSDTGVSTGTRLRNANLNLGLTYDLTHALHLNASANVNVAEANGGGRNGSSNQAAGLNYRPSSKKIGDFDYNWGVGGSVSSGAEFGGENRTSQAGMQLSHGLSRSVNLGEGSWLNFDMSQSLSASKMFEAPENTQDYSRQITHSAAASWMHNENGASAMVRLSVSDSRALEGTENYFQLINLQASSNLPTGGYTAWSGGITLQATRQGSKNELESTRFARESLFNASNNRDEFVTTSSGSVTYQNSRLFGVRRLRFVSDLRLNSDALLPLFSGPQSQEMAAWDNRIDYSIGRTQLRVSTMVARIKQPSGLQNSAAGSSESRSKINKAIMFSVMRSFGDL